MEKEVPECLCVNIVFPIKLDQRGMTSEMLPEQNGEMCEEFGKNLSGCLRFHKRCQKSHNYLS